MFVFNRSALAVLLPLAVLVTAPRKLVAESERPAPVETQTVVANLPSR